MRIAITTLVVGLLILSEPLDALAAQALILADPAAPGAVVPTPGLSLIGLRADVQGDGLDDLFLFDGRDTLVFYGTGVWPPPTLDPTLADVRIRDARAEANLVGDVNGDGIDDVTLRTATDFLLIFGGASWPAEMDLGAAGVSTLNLEGGHAALGDVDGDGIDDVALIGTRQARLYLGRPSWPARISDVPLDSLVAPGNRYASLTIGDVTGDGLGDLVFAGFERFSSSEFVVVAGRAGWPAEVSDDVAAFAANREDSHALIADVTGDGIGDIVAWLNVGTRGLVRVYAGGPALVGEVATHAELSLEWVHFMRPDPRPYGPMDSALLRAGDLDGDGVDDLLALLELDGPRGRNSGVPGFAVWLGPIAAGTHALEELDAVLFGRASGCTPGPALLVGASGTDELQLLFGETADCDPADQSLVLAPALADWPPVTAQTLHVDGASGDDGAAGLSWTDPVASVGAALNLLDRSFGPATVLVGKGRYRESVTLGRRTTLLGGYDVANRERDLDGPDTVLDASGRQDRVVDVLAAPRAWSSRIDGFLLTGGEHDGGAGLRLGRGDHLASNLWVAGNLGKARTYPIDLGCTTASGTPWTWSGCTKSFYATAGVALNGGRLVNSLVADNRVDLDQPICGAPPPRCESAGGNFDGPTIFIGGVRASSSRLRIEQCTITGNESTGLSSPSDDLVVDRSISWGNELDLDGQGELIATLAGTGTLGVGVPLRSDPLFVAPTFQDYSVSQVAAGQAADSPALNAASIEAEVACLGANPDWCASDGSTRSDGGADAGWADLGWHRPRANEAPAFAGLVEARPLTDCGVVLEWQPASDSDAPLLYRIFGADSPGAWDFGAPLAEVMGVTRWIDASLAWGEERHYLVRAVDARGLSEQNQLSASAVAADESPPTGSLELLELSGCEPRLALTVADDCSGLATSELHRSEDIGFTPGPGTLLIVDPGAEFVDSVPSNGNWHYRLLARDAAGNGLVSAPTSVRVTSCTGAVPPPGEVPQVLLHGEGTETRVSWTPAPGADLHRLYRGSLDALRAGVSDHAASVGPDGIEDTPDDVGACALETLELRRPIADWPGDVYLLVSGLNVAGEGTLGVDSLGAVRASGLIDCP